MSGDFEERAQDAGTLRWRFERVLQRATSDVGDQLGQGGPERLVGLRALIASLPSLFAFFAEGQPWEDAALDAILLDWLADKRRLDISDAAGESIHVAARALAMAAIAGAPLSKLDAASTQLLASIADE